MILPVGAAGTPRALSVTAAVTVVTHLPVFFFAAMSVDVARDLGFGSVGKGSAIGLYFGAVALSVRPLGVRVDRLGSTGALRLAMVGLVASSAAIAVLARNWVSLAVGLACVGVATALAAPASNRLLVNRVRTARLGTAFGLKHSAGPVASMLAGLSVPVFLTLGWRWAFVATSVAAVCVVAAVGPRPEVSVATRRAAARRVSQSREARLQLRHMFVAFLFISASSAIVLAYSVEHMVATGYSEARSGVLFAVASMLAIATRLMSGVVVDRTSARPIQVCLTVSLAGAAGSFALAAGPGGVAWIGVAVALAGTWGLQGVYWYALVSQNPTAPGEVTGAVAPAAVGGLVGPPAFGLLTSTVSSRAAWVMVVLLCLVSASALRAAATRAPEPTPA